MKENSTVDVGGRPTKYSAERAASIIDAISKNIPYKLAAEANGIGESTLYDWIKYGREDKAAGIDSDFVRFSELIKKTELVKIDEHLKYMQEGGKGWQARAWILERRWRELFGADAGIIQELLKQFEELKSQLGDKAK